MKRCIRNVISGGVAAGMLVSAISVSRADEIKPEDKGKWESVAALGVTLTRGNSKTFLASASINSTRKWTQDEALLGLNAGYGESTVNAGTKDEKTGTTDNYVKGFAQWNHTFSDFLSTNFYGGGRLGADYDAIAKIDYRVTISPLLGYYFVRTTNAFIAAEAGPSFIDQKLASKTKDYFALRIGERGEYKFAGGAKVWETVDILPQVDDFHNWIANAEVGVSAPISKRVDVRLVLQDTYQNVHPDGRKNNDLKLIAALGFKF